ncbi:hypothetical protein G826_03785 [Escherichia coli HVH 171 (4-3191958)]|nr:hypothetical protein G826_03785 [Escherichia coli HVH 171 (4-3191958)]
MQSVPEGVIQAPESPDAPESSVCADLVQAMASDHPPVTGTITRTAVRNFSRIAFIPEITGSLGQ